MIFSNDISRCLQVLNRGGLILYPTDTVWGIGCDATNESAVEKIYKLKKRNDHKAMIILLPELRELEHYVERPVAGLLDYLLQCSKPTSVVYDGAKGLAKNLMGPGGSVAFRICKEPFCYSLLMQFGRPIVSTSANFSGKPAPGNFASIEDEIKKSVDYVVQYRQDDHSENQPSSVVRWTPDGITVIRS